MKKLILLIILFLVFHEAFTQTKLPIDSITNKVTFKKIIELDSTYDADHLFSLTKEWFSTNNKIFNRSNSDKNYNTGAVLFGLEKGNSTSLDQLYQNTTPLKYEDPTAKKIIGKGVTKYTGTALGCLRLLYVEYDIKVYIKDSKVKIEYTNFNYSHYNPATMKKCQMYGFNDEAPCNSKNTLENLLTCDHCNNALDDFYIFLTADISKMANGFKNFLNKNKKTQEDW